MVSETTKFKVFYFLRYFGDAFFYPFMSMYFLAKGISEQNLGIILAIVPITTILVNPFWNYVVKDMRTSRLVLKIMTLLEGIFIILLTQVSGFELYALLVGLIAFFCSPFINIHDGYTATYTNTHKLQYSSIRIYASIAYVIASAIAGFIIQYVGYTLPFLMSGAFFIFTTIIAFWVKPIEKAIPASQNKQRDFKSLIKNIEFYKYLIFYTIAIGAVRIGDSFFGVFLTTQSNLGLAGYGLLYSGFVFVEVLTLRYLTMRGSSFKERNLVLFASVLLIIRFLTYAIDLPLPVLIVITMLRGVSWGTIIYTHIKFVIKIVKLENITTAILILTLSFSIFIGIGNILFGRLIQVFGYNFLYLMVTILVVFGTTFFLFFTPKANEPVDEIEQISSL